MATIVRHPPRLSPRAYQRIAAAAVVSFGFIVVAGAAVRLTGSGLGCSDWPNCTQDHFVAELQYHQMIEFVNRTFTGLVSVAAILAVLGSLWRVPRRRDLIWLSAGLVAGVVAQIVLGGLVVLLDLRPTAVIAHFLVSAVLIWDAVVLYERASRDTEAAEPIVPARSVWLGRAMVVAAAAVLVAGTVVTAAGPHGGDERAKRLSLDLLWATRVHSGLAWLLLALVVATLWSAYRVTDDRRLRTRGGWVVAAVLVQGAIGYVQYFNGIPPLLVLVHVLGAVTVWTAVLLFHLGQFRASMDA